MSGIPDDMTDIDDPALDYALGALGRAELRAADLRLARDPAFRAEVEAWQKLLGPLAETVVPSAPPPAVWDLIEADIAPARARTTAPVAETRSGWASLSLWRGLALSSTALAAVAAILLMARPDTPDQPLLVATLASPEGAALLTATYDASRGAVILTPAGKNDAAGRTPELWVIEGDNPPRSLGTIDIVSPESHTIPADRLKGLTAGSTLAISLEPKGGSKTGAPTGPIVATGKLTGI